MSTFSDWELDQVLNMARAVRQNNTRSLKWEEPVHTARDGRYVSVIELRADATATCANMGHVRQFFDAGAPIIERLVNEVRALRQERDGLLAERDKRAEVREEKDRGTR
jgi:hypothetical protein